MHELADVLAIERYNLTRWWTAWKRMAWWCARAARVMGAPRLPRSPMRAGCCVKRWGIYESTVDELFLSQLNAEQRQGFSDALERTAGLAMASAQTRGRRRSETP